MALTTRARISITGTLTGTGDLGTPSAPFAFNVNESWASGTAADQADLVFPDQRQLAASGTEDLDLAGALSSALGATITMAKLKLLAIKVVSGSIVIGGGNTTLGLFDAAADSVTLTGADAALILVNPSAAGLCSIAAGSSDLLTITNPDAGNTAEYQIVAVGTSA